MKNCCASWKHKFNNRKHEKALIRGSIDKIFTLYSQNPTFASTWQKKQFWVKGRTRNPRTTTDTSLPSWLLIAKLTISYYAIYAVVMQKWSSTSCRLYNRAIHQHRGIRYACGCITQLYRRQLVEENFCIRSISINIFLLSINPFLLLPIEWPSVYY